MKTSAAQWQEYCCLDTSGRPECLVLIRVIRMMVVVPLIYPCGRNCLYPSVEERKTSSGQWRNMPKYLLLIDEKWVVFFVIHQGSETGLCKINGTINAMFCRTFWGNHCHQMAFVMLWGLCNCQQVKLAYSSSAKCCTGLMSILPHVSAPFHRCLKLFTWGLSGTHVKIVQSFALSHSLIC